MDPQKTKLIQDTTELSDDHAWQPEILDGERASDNHHRDYTLSEVWNWYHARLKQLGHLSNTEARLLALLNWRDSSLDAALHTARLEVNQMPGDESDRKAHLEYLAGEYLARETLGMASIPRIEPRPA